MRQWSLVVGGLLVGGIVVAACSSDVNVFDTPGKGGAGEGGAGGEGGTEGVAEVASSVMSSSATGTFDTVCDEACQKLDEECGLGEVCSLVPALDCDGNSGECVAGCVLDADCGAIYSLFIGSDPDEELRDCVQECQGDECGACVAQECTSELQACTDDEECGEFLQCSFECETPQCTDDCFAKHPSEEAKVLLSCAVAECPSCTGVGG